MSHAFFSDPIRPHPCKAGDVSVALSGVFDERFLYNVAFSQIHHLLPPSQDRLCSGRGPGQAQRPRGPPAGHQEEEGGRARVRDVR